MALVGQFLDSAWQSITGFLQGGTVSTEVVLPITVLAVVGILGGRIFSELLKRLLKLSGVDDLAVKADVQKILRRVGYRGSFSDLIGDSFRYFIYIVVVLAGLNVLGLPSFLSYLQILLAYIPNIFSAIAVIFFGLLFFSHAEEFIVGFYRREGIMNAIDGTEPSLPSYKVLAKFIRYLGVVFTFVLAAAILGLNIVFIYILTAIIVTGAVGMFIIGFSGVFKNLAVSVYLQHSQTFLSGNTLQVDGERGKLVHVTPLYTKLKKSDGYIYVPNTELLEKNVEYEE